MPPPSKIGTVFVHCGTNNASTVKAGFRFTEIRQISPIPRNKSIVRISRLIENHSKQNMSITQSAKEMEHCVETLCKFYTHAKIVVSAILPRNDENNLRAMDINNLIEQWCIKEKQVHFVDFCPEFAVRGRHPEKFSHLYRYERTKNHPDPAMVDAIHLSEKGVDKFQVKFSRTIKMQILLFKVYNTIVGTDKTTVGRGLRCKVLESR